METNEVIISGALLKKLIEKKSEPVIQKYGLRPVELDILLFLGKEGAGDTARDIMNRRHISKAHISKSVDNLKQGGFIRLSEDSSDHRVNHIEMTDLARDAVAEATAIYIECLRIMYSGISEEDHDVVKRVIRTITENINKELECCV